MSRKKETNRSNALAWAASVLAMATVSAGIAAQETGRCYTADVPAAIVLPDGSEYEPGQLKICLTSKGPVEGSHRTYVDGRAIGEFRSRLGEGEGSTEAADAIFVFLRNPEGKLVLQGYAAAQGDRFWTFRMGQARRSMTAWRLDGEPKEDETAGGQITRIAGNE